MNINVGKFAGFCDGVKYAVENTFSQSNKSEDIYVDGHLVHNPQTIELLQKSGVHTYDANEDMSILDGKTVIIRAHGVSPDRRAKLASHAKKVVNLTCKYVAKIQGLVKKHSGLGYRVIVIGNPDHPEIIGVCGYADDVYVVYKEEDLLKLPDEPKKSLIVAQTTIQKNVFDNFVQKIQEKYRDVEIIVKNTICEATEQRQTEILDIAKKNDVVLVIGGSHSSNTKNLYKIASEIKPTFYVEFKEDLNKINLSPYKNIGIMAGASTPDWLINEIVEIIKDKYSSPVKKMLYSIFDFLCYSYLFFSFGIFLMTYAIYDILSKDFNYKLGLVSSLYYLFMSIGNGYSNYTLKISDKKKYIFYQNNKMVLYPIMGTAIIAMLYSAYSLNISVFMFLIVATILGIWYNIGFNKKSKFNNSFILRILKKLIPFKAIITSIAMTFLVNGTLFMIDKNIIKEKTFAFIFSVLIVFVFMFVRKALIEIKFSQSDKIAGATTLTTYIEAETLAKITGFIPSVLLLTMVIGVVLKQLSIDIQTLKYIVPILYSSCVSFLVMKKDIIRNRHLFSFLIDSPLYILFLFA